MLEDHYGLAVSTTSAAARDAYVQGCDLYLSMYPGALAAFDQAIAADPNFTLAFAGKARVQQLRGDLAARESMTAASAVASELSPRVASHLAFFGSLVAGQAAAALAALRVHLGVRQRPDRVVRPRRAEARAAGAVGRSCGVIRG